jgi:hypothetical protein
MKKGHLLLSVACEVGNFIAFEILFEKFAKVDGHVLSSLFNATTDANKVGKA